MGWGFLMGLGQGMQQVGGMMQDNAKTKLHDQLAQDREQRALQREKLKPVSKRRYQSDGVWREVGVNSMGEDVGEARLLNSQEITDINAKEQEIRDEAKKRALSVTLAEKKLADYDEDRALDREYRQSLIDNKDRQYTGLGGRGGTGSSRPQFVLPGGEQVTQKQAEKMFSDELVDNGDAPRGIADYLGKKKIAADVNGGEFNYAAPQYSKLDDEGKAKADKLSAIMIAAAKQIDAGTLTREQAAEKIKKATGVTRKPSDFDSWIKIARGR